MKFRSSLDKFRRGKPAASKIETASLKIDALNHDGDGVGRINGQAVFVPYTAPGDTVKVEITERHKRWLRAVVHEYTTRSEDRTEPPCEYFMTCGGCRWQHLSYKAQIHYKQRHVTETLQRIGKIDATLVRDIVASPKFFQYRNRIRGMVKDSGFHFRKANSDELVMVSHCAIASDAINSALGGLSEKLKTSSHPTNVALIELLQQIDGNNGTALGNNTGNHKNNELTIELAEQIDGTVSAMPVNEQRTTTLGFRQVNDSVSELLSAAVFSVIRQRVKPVVVETQSVYSHSAEKQRVLDLYCGHGGWSIDIANEFPMAQVVGVDMSEHNIHAATQNAKNVSNVTFIQTKAEKHLSKNHTKHDCVIVDPPRAGLSEPVVNALCASPVNTLLYISCHPATLARDLLKLTIHAYKVDSVQPFDMFPQTAHVECFAVLSRVRA